MSDAIDQIQLPDGYHVKQYSGTTLPDRTDRFSMKWDGEWHITVEVFRDLGLAFAAVLVLIYVLVVVGSARSRRRWLSWLRFR